MQLTAREEEVVDLLSAMETPKSIAVLLGIHIDTVYAHVCNVAKKIPPSADPPLWRVRKWALSKKLG